MRDRSVWTVGHSTRSLDEFIALLKAHDIRRVADVRTVPRSRRHPHFASEALAAALTRENLVYRHFAGLGGLRKPKPDSRNLAWTNESFRGYADHMGTRAFEEALVLLEEFAVEPTAIMCAEAVWWRCHRQLIADALVARGHRVLHIMTAAPADAHRVTSFARVDDGRVTYPGLLG